MFLEQQIIMMPEGSCHSYILNFFFYICGEKNNKTIMRYNLRTVRKKVTVAFFNSAAKKTTTTENKI